MRIGQARRSFLLRCKSEGLSSASVIFYRNQIRYYWRWLYDHQRVNKWLETDTLRTYFAWMQKRVDAGEIQPETADSAYRAMRALCRWLLAQEEIAKDPFSKIARPKVPAKMPRCIEIDEYSQLVRSIPHAHWTDARDRLAIVILFWCGLRVNELVELRLADIDMEASMLTVRAGKGGDPRYAPLLPVVKTAFFAYIYDRPAVKTQYLFMASNGMGAPLSRGLRESGIRQMLERRCDAAGIKRKNPHSFRHGIAMHLLNDLGADMSFISEILGHKDEKTTEKFYARWKSEGLAKKYAKLVSNSAVE